MTPLEAFPPEIKQIISLIHFSFKVDVAVFDPKSRIIACTDEYLRQKGKIVHAPSIEEVITNENVVVTVRIELGEFEILGDAQALVDAAQPPARLQVANVVHARAKAVAAQGEGVAPAARYVMLFTDEDALARLGQGDGRREASRT